MSEETKRPTREEVGEWLRWRQGGAPMTPQDIGHRIGEAYLAALDVIEKARPCVELDADGCRAVLFNELYDSMPRLDALAEALAAFDGKEGE